VSAELSREVGRILGKANPTPPTLQQRAEVISAMESGAETIGEFPKEVQELLRDLRNSASR